MASVTRVISLPRDNLGGYCAADPVFKRATACFVLSRLLPTCTLLALLPVPARSQVAIDWWTADNGLPQNIVRAICQTRMVISGSQLLTVLFVSMAFGSPHSTEATRPESRAIASARCSARREETSGRARKEPVSRNITNAASPPTPRATGYLPTTSRASRVTTGATSGCWRVAISLSGTQANDDSFRLLTKNIGTLMR